MKDTDRNKKELIVLVADLDAENALRGILGRCEALNIRKLEHEIDYEILRHPQRDSGCRSNAEDFLESYVNTHRRALVIFDRDGCGWEDRDATEIEKIMEQRLVKAGWNQQYVAAIVIVPELEAWVWSSSPHVDAELGWRGHTPKLRDWLAQNSLLPAGQIKPADPKKAMLGAMRQVKKSCSSRVFSRLAEKVSLQGCQDRAFNKLLRVLQQWFAADLGNLIE
ncbi:MAG TPA: hypothetical protein PKV86_01470 [Syntrophobacteraceae bacterium]|nr:hypothetical protein [Syntrophobacteraceae bacterium]